MATTKQQRRFSGMQNVAAAHRRNSKTTTAAPAPAAEQTDVLTVKLEVSPVNSVPAAPAEPAAAPEVPVVPEDPKAAAEAPEVPEQKEPATPAAPAAPSAFSVEQELQFIAMGLKTLLGVKGDLPLTRDGLLLVGLRTVRQTLMGVLANEEAMAGIKEKREELISKAKALVPQTSPAEAAGATAEAAPSWAVRMR